jgi:hypothetical protein
VETVVAHTNALLRSNSRKYNEVKAFLGTTLTAVESVSNGGLELRVTRS